MVAPRFSACSGLSRRQHPEPSPITNPLQSYQMGSLKLWVGSSVEAVGLGIQRWQGVIETSVPPPTSHLGNQTMERKGIPIASFDEEQAVDGLQTPFSTLYFPHSRSHVGKAFAGRNRGLTRLVAFHAKAKYWSSFLDSYYQMQQ